MKTSHAPSRMFLRFFRWYCHPKLRDHIEGDLMEEYYERVKTTGRHHANAKFITDVLLLFRPGIIRPIDGYKTLTTYGMYKSYLRIGWRNLVKNKGYSFINIAGLAMGMAVAMMIGLWIHDESQFNKYHNNYNTIARVMKHGTLNGETTTHPNLPYPLAYELKTKHSENFKHVVLAWPIGEHILTMDEKYISATGEFIEPAAPEMFGLNMVQGSRAGLSDPHAILLSRSTAKAFFGNENPLGKLLTIDNTMEVKVTGVYEDLPYNTTFYNVHFFAPWELLTASNEWIKYQGFTNDFLEIYVQLENTVAFETASVRIKDAILDNIQNDKVYTSTNPQIFLHPMENWRLRSAWKNGEHSGGLIQVVWLFGIIGGFVLLLACINFMNLSTARSEKRSKEVGIRKAIGSLRQQLVHQFFSESFLVVMVAFIVALVVVSASLTWFNTLAGKQIQMPWTNFYFWSASFVFIMATGILAGSYPAFYLSSFNTVRVLKGTFRVGPWASFPRRVLVVMQFTVSVSLIMGTIVVYQQIEFGKNRPVGYSRNGLLMIEKTSPAFRGKYEVLRTELKKTAVVTEIAESSSPLTDIWNSNGGFNWAGKDPAFVPEFATITVTPEYGQTVGWQFVNGRDFSREIASDSAAFVINEAAARVLGFENPVGQTVHWAGGWQSKFSSFTVIGVVKDMVMKSPYAPTTPAVFLLSSAGTNWLNIRINPQTSTGDAIAKIESVFRKVIPSVAFDYKFVDQEYALKFAEEERIGKLAAIFSVLAISISCLGLFGLASFVSEQRTKEIGIRKIVGASVFALWRMLSRDFLVLVIISCLIAIPASSYFLNAWLQQYEYRTEMSVWIFLGTSLVALVTTLLTVSYQALRAALMSPVKSLRSE